MNAAGKGIVVTPLVWEEIELPALGKFYVATCPLLGRVTAFDRREQAIYEATRAARILALVRRTDPA